jgi:glycosyltransferase involved in cell wall biosynthesis
VEPPRVSVVIPTYDRARLVCEAIDSALAQEGVALEVVVVDDGSRDDTPAVLAARYGADPRVRVVRQANAGTASARNAGNDLARGEYVSPFDSDDLMKPGRLAKMAAALDAHPEADLVIADSEFSGNPAWAGKSAFRDSRRPPPTSLQDLCDGSTTSPSTFVLRAAAAKALRFEDGRTYCEDVEFLFRFFDSGRRAVLLPEVLTVRRFGVGGAGAAPNMTASDAVARRAHLVLQEAWVHRAARPRSARARLSRRWAKFYEGIGDPRSARPHLWAWWRREPWQLRALAKLWKTVGRGAPRGSAPPATP